MKVIYDASLLGEGQLDVRARTGIYRVVAHVAHGLARLPECQLAFCATKHLQPSIEYCREQPDLREVPFVQRDFLGSLHRDLRGVNRRLRSGDTGRRRDLGMRAVRTMLHRTERLVAWSTGRIERLTGQFARPTLEAADVFHSPFYPVHREARRAAKLTRFQTIYDMIPAIRPEFCDPTFTQFFHQILGSVDADSWVITISEASRADLCSHARIDPARVFVTPLAADPMLFYPCREPAIRRSVRQKYGIPDGPFLLSVGTLQPRKNMEHVIRCFARLVRQERLHDLTLVLVGPNGWQYDGVFEAMEACQGLRDRIFLTGYVADEDLAALYSQALAFVFMSLYEGFGLPPLEAMQCGVPVVASNTSSLPEVVGEAGILLDPHDSDGLCESLSRIYHDSWLREALIVRSLERAREFTWPRCASETLAAYTTALRGGTAPPLTRCSPGAAWELSGRAPDRKP